MSRKTPMTEKEFTDKLNSLREKAAVLQQDLINAKKRIKSNEEEIQRTEEEYIISNFRNQNISAVEIVSHMGKLQNRENVSPADIFNQNVQTANEKNSFAGQTVHINSYTSKEDDYNDN